MLTPRSFTALAAVAGLSTPSFVPLAGLAQEIVDLPRADRPLSAEFEEVYRIDAETIGLSEESGGLGLVQLAFDAEGELHVFERRYFPDVARVLTLATDGALVREFGRMGWERGDFRGPTTGFAVFPDGRTVVQDGEHSAYMIFDSEGDYERMVRYPRQTAGGMAAMLGNALPGREIVAAGRAGAAVFRTRISEQRMDVNQSTFAMSMQIEGPTGVVERVGLEGNRVVVDTVVRAWRPREGVTMKIDMSIDMSRADLTGDVPPDLSSMLSLGEVQMPWAFGPPFAFAVLPDNGVAFVDSTTYEVKFVNPQGEPTKILRRPVGPAPVTEELRRRVVDLMDEARAEGVAQVSEMMEGAGIEAGAAQIAGISDLMRSMAGRFFEEMEFFSEVPALADVRATWEGTLWLSRSGDPLASFEDLPAFDFGALLGIGWLGGGGMIDVLSPEGSYVGTLPAGTVPPDAFGPDGLAAWIEDDDAGSAIVVRRIPEAIRLP